MGLYAAVRASKYDTVICAPILYGILELYNIDSNTFFTPTGEIRIALHEMLEVSCLPMGDRPYEECFPTNEELNTLSHVVHIVDAFRELVCHFLICQRTTTNAGHDSTVPRIPWAEYLLPNVSKKGNVGSIPPATDAEVETRIFKDDFVLHTTESDVCGFRAGDQFESFHHQAKEPISELVLLAGFFSIWLKGCVVPSRPKDRISIKVLYPAVLLVSRYNLALLPEMVSCIHHDLRELATEYLKQEDRCPRNQVPNPRVELPYMYLVIWFTQHYSPLMSAATPGGANVALLQRYERLKCVIKYLAGVRRLLQNKDRYRLYCYFPSIDGVNPGDEFEDGMSSERFTCLPSGCFNWLVNIRPGHLIARLNGTECYIEPYLPCQFTHQFGYDQLYVGNPNPGLLCTGSLIDGARAWYYFVAGITGARFSLPHHMPNCYMTLGVL